MIRLALLGNEGEAGECLRLAPRLRDVSLVAVDDTRAIDGKDVDGVVVLSSKSWQDGSLQDPRAMVGFTDRFRPSVRAIKDSLETGELGDPGLIRIHRWCCEIDPATDVLADIDLGIWMFGALPAEVYTIARPGPDDLIEYIQVHLGFPKGGMGLIDVSRRPASAESYYSLSLIGSSGAAYADDHRNQQLLFRGNQTAALRTAEGDAARLAQLEEFAKALQERRDPVVTAADADAALRVRDAALQSAESGRTAHFSGERYEC